MNDNRGFTLIEILLVVVIIGVLAAVIVPKFSGQSMKAKIVGTKASMAGIETMLDMFELDNGRFPSTEEGLEALLEEPDSEPALNNWDGPYGDRKETFLDGFRRPFIYESPGENNTEGYEMYSTGPDGKEGTDDDIDNWTREE